KSDWETEDSGQHDKPDHPVRNLEEWKNLRGDLDQKPCSNAVSDCRPIDVAPFQFGKKVSRVHSFPTTPFLISYNNGRGKISFGSFVHAFRVGRGTLQIPNCQGSEF